MTPGVCDRCWGSGDERRRWADLRKVAILVRDRDRLKVSLEELVSAMEKYEMDVDEEPPHEYRGMMQRARKALGEENVLPKEAV